LFVFETEVLLKELYLLTLTFTLLLTLLFWLLSWPVSGTSCVNRYQCDAMWTMSEACAAFQCIWAFIKKLCGAVRHVVVLRPRVQVDGKQLRWL